jgi:hypothetical protein
MKRIVLLCFLFAALALQAQAQSKPTVLKAKQGDPVLETKAPSYQGFESGFVTFAEMEGTSFPFSLVVEASPWFFEVKGKVESGINRVDLPSLGDDLVGVLAYYDAEGITKNRVLYQSAPYDFQFYVRKNQKFEPAVIQDLEIRLLGEPAMLPIADKVLRDAQNWSLARGKAFTMTVYANELYKAQTSPLYKENLDELALEQKRKVESLTKKRATKKHVKKSKSKSTKKTTKKSNSTKKKNR